METTEVEKSSAPGSEETSQLNRNRSFKSKQLVRSQAIRETHSPPRALSPAQPTPTVTISATTVANSTPSVGNTVPSVENASHINNNASNIENGTNDTENNVRNITTSPSVGSSPPSVGNFPPGVGNLPPSVVNSSVTSEKASNERTVSVSEDSSHVSVRCSEVVNSSDVKHSDSDDFKKKQPVEIQITSGGWDDSHHERHRPRRWHSDAPRDLLSNNPRVSCVCGYCAACVHCRGRRRRHYCPTKQDSGIVCPDDCPDNEDHDIGASNNNDTMRKSTSLDVEDQPYYCRCPERKETRPRTITRNDSDDRYEPTGPELVNFIKDTLNKNMRDRMALLKIERELHALVNDTGRCIVRFPVMTSYGRMLVHRCAALFQLSHHLDMTNKTSVLVSKSGTSGGRIPCTSFKEWCTASFPPSPLRHQPDPPHAKSILKRDTHSLDEPGAGSLANNRSKSLEQREKEYEKVRRRIFSSQDESQWPWLATGPIKLLTPEAGGRNKLLKVQSLEGSGPGSSGSWRGARGPVSKSHSFGGYAAAEPHTPRLLSRQGDLASSSWRLSPSSSGYKTLSLRSTDSITPSPTGGASPEPGVNANIPVSSGVENAGVVWCVTDMSAVPPGAMVIHPHTGRPLTNPDGTVYQFDPANPPVLYDPTAVQNDQQKLDPSSEKRRGRLEKQHSFIDNEGECQPNEECRNKCCCDCRRDDGCQLKTTTEKETTTKPPSPFEPTTQTLNTQEETPPKQQQQQLQQQPDYEQPSNQHSEQYEIANQQPAYEPPTNQKAYEAVRSFEPANQNVVNNGVNGRVGKSGSEGQEVQYQAYQQGYRGEEVTSPPQMVNHFVPHEVPVQVMPQQKVPQLPLPDPNIRQMPITNMTNMVYQAPMTQGYNPYQCRVEPSLQMYPQVLQTEEHKLAPSPHTNENAFRIDPSYPYAAVDVSAAACQACVDTNTMQTMHQHPQRSYSVPYGQMEVPQQVLPPYPVGNVLLQQPHLQQLPAYPQYQEQLPWAVPSHGIAPQKLMLPELYPIMQYPQPTYQHYNIVYPQVIQQPYPICQPVYPVIDNKQQDQRRNSLSNRPSKRNSVSGSARATPSNEEKANYDESTRNNEIAAKIQQIKSQMAQLDTRDYRFDKDKRGEWRRRNSGSGILGNCPVSSLNNRVMGRGSNDDKHLSTAARAIVDTIRNMQAKNTYHDNRRDYQRHDHKYDRPDRHTDYRRRDRDDNKDNARTDGQTDRYDPRRGLNVPVYRQPYLLRQMTPGTWCRRSPGPVHPVLNPPRRPHPDARNPRR
ncbi:hypothetical protein PYW08_011388 [Mythimna loreyi]|uniref:Uncharacterized protein n=1 Tax=Mythimna loreyi TaxID=667449 RepID=A0ACC2Q3C4_9NEOP|nr:hypothetical protein PYW08_011388 [Mythimna loreyi]